ncbi:TPR repeat/Tetratricopeptide repeat [Novymonas esmeraldas]|uniref:TPR repeat/Tetratricopeptide repeat n=1 Tax=Novymonas esmeraldas TaxID=1808958 RepID=A0AAW0F459_9TRYP
MSARPAKEPPLSADLKARLDALTAVRWDAASAAAAAQLSQLRLDWKELGNACYGAGSFLVAIRCYTRLLELPGGDTATIRSNRSAAYVQSSMLAGPALALKDAERAVELEPQWFKAHLRVGDAQRRRGHFPEADAAYRAALALQPDCAAAQAALRAMQAEAEDLPAAAATFPQTRYQARRPSHDASPSPPTTLPHAASPRGEEALEMTPEQLVRRWKEDTSTRDDRTGCRPRKASLSHADRERGAAVKEALLARFRAKVESNDALSDTLRVRREEALLQGDSVDYRDADRLRRTYAHATNGIGLGITSDSYKEFTGRVDHRTW